MPKYKKWKQPYYGNKESTKPDLVSLSDKNHEHSKKENYKRMKQNQNYKDYLKKEKNKIKYEDKQKAIILQKRRAYAEQRILFKLYNNEISPENVERIREGIPVTGGHGRLDPRLTG